jgi:hypothetical protein
MLLLKTFLISQIQEEFLSFYKQILEAKKDVATTLESLMHSFALLEVK